MVFHRGALPRKPKDGTIAARDNAQFPTGRTVAPPSVIAIDGPAAAGKSALAERLARALGYVFFDSGALYRAVTWAAHQHGVDPRDEAGLANLARRLDIRIEPSDGSGRHAYRVLVDGRDVTASLFQPEIDARVSVVSAHPRLRQVLLPLQRQIAARGGVVMAGRDIGTVVLPDAPLKLFVRAGAATRAGRRYEQLRRRGVDADLATVLAEMERRDRLDSGRAVAPLAIAPDAVVIDSDQLSLDEELALALRLVRQRDP
ncbi:MAG: (d)CMP kinase [Chloroflexi bacterium]|nr:(d)CMP kinase [Chloroflexota bacterium]